MKLSGMIALAVAATLTATSAHAADYCFNMSGIMTLVVKGFRAPAPGKCKPFKAAYLQEYSGVVIGAACTNSLGDTTRLHMSFVSTSGSSYNGRLDFAYPGLASGTFNLNTAFALDTVWEQNGAATAAPCASPVPIL